MFILEFFYHQLITTPLVPTTSLAGQTIIITGGNRGLGFEAAKQIIRLGASKLILAVRSTSAGEDAKTKLLKDNPSKLIDIEVWSLDMSSYASVKSFAQRAETLPRIDALLNNAGILTSNFNIVEEDETTLTVNLISTYLLILLMLPKLRESAENFSITPRISIVGSEGMNWVSFKERKAKDGQIFASLNNKAATDMSERYFLSKLLVIFCLRELAAQMDISTNNGSKGRQVILNCPAPGFVATDLAQEHKGSTLFRTFEKLVARDVEVGSRCIVDAVARGQESHGQYLSECKIKPVGKFTRSEEGGKVAKRVWNEVIQKLEKIQPRISENI